LKAGISRLSPDIVKPYFDYVGPQNETLDLSYAYDEWTNSSAAGGLADLGFGSHTQTSIMEHMLEPTEFQTFLRANLGIEGAERARALSEDLKTKRVSRALKQLIKKADVVAFSGGNPDVIAYVLRVFPGVADMLTSKLYQGQAVLLGRSAGSMVPGANGMFSSEETPEMFENLLSGSSHTLGLLPKCIMKPHFKTELHEADAILLEETSGLHVVRMANKMALACMSGSCILQGTPDASDLKWHPSPGNYMKHLAKYFESV